MDPTVVKGKWTASEDDILRTNVPLNTGPVARGGAKKKTSWAKVAKELRGRNGKQARERWMNHIGPNVIKGVFSAAEDTLMQALHKRHNGKWVLIAQNMPGRTANAIKNRFNAGKRKEAREARPGGASKASKGRPEKKKNVTNLPAYGVMIVSSVAKLSGGVPQCSAAQFAKVAGDPDIAPLHLIPVTANAAVIPSFSIAAIVDECFRTWPSMAASDVNGSDSLQFKSGAAARVVPLRQMLATEARKLGHRGLFNIVSTNYTTELSLAPWPTWIAKMTHFQLAQIRDEALKDLTSTTRSAGEKSLDRSLMSEVLTVYTSQRTGQHKNPAKNGVLSVRPSFQAVMSDASAMVGLGVKRKGKRPAASAAGAPGAAASAAGGAASSRKKPRGNSSTQVQL